MGEIKLEWDDYGKAISLKKVKKVEDKLGITFPDEYIDYARKYPEGYPNKTDFDMIEPDGSNSSGYFGSLLSLSKKSDYYLFEEYKDMLEQTGIKKLIPIIETGSGDYVCLDYEVFGRLDQPKIAYWFHDYEPDRSIVLLADNFTEFLSMLYEPDDSE
jgi:hypothetical protein